MRTACQSSQKCGKLPWRRTEYSQTKRHTDPSTSIPHFAERNSSHIKPSTGDAQPRHHLAIEEHQVSACHLELEGRRLLAILRGLPETVQRHEEEYLPAATHRGHTK